MLPEEMEHRLARARALALMPPVPLDRVSAFQRRERIPFSSRIKGPVLPVAQDSSRAWEAFFGRRPVHGPPPAHADFKLKNLFR